MLAVVVIAIAIQQLVVRAKNITRSHRVVVVHINHAVVSPVSTPCIVTGVELLVIAPELVILLLVESVFVLEHPIAVAYPQLSLASLTITRVFVPSSKWAQTPSRRTRGPTGPCCASSRFPVVRPLSHQHFNFNHFC